MKNQYRKINRNHLSLGDLIEIVNSCSRNQRETLATLQDLFTSGRVCVKNSGKAKRIRLSPSLA